MRMHVCTKYVPIDDGAAGASEGATLIGTYCGGSCCCCCCDFLFLMVPRFLAVKFEAGPNGGGKFILFMRCSTCIRPHIRRIPFPLSATRTPTPLSDMSEDLLPEYRSGAGA